MRVVCINDHYRPDEIPNTHWVVEGKIYTVKKVMKCNVQGGLLGFELEEIDLKPFSPYEYFAHYRFAPVPDPKKKQELETNLIDDNFVEA